MTRSARRLGLRLVRVVSLLLVTSLGTVLLMRSAPGYFDDERELNAEHADGARASLQAQRHEGALHAWATFAAGALHGDLGISRQYGTPVWPLLIPRLKTTLRLLVPAIVAGSLVALALATVAAALRRSHALGGLGGAATVVCALPVSVLALHAMISGFGGPAGVLFVLIVARDFRFFSRLLRRHAAAPWLQFARMSGVATWRLTLRHMVGPVRHEIAALLITSCLFGLNAMLPVEVIFGVPGVGQLAWNAAMNRDLPVLLAVSLLLSLAIGLATLLDQRQTTEAVA